MGFRVKFWPDVCRIRSAFEGQPLERRLDLSSEGLRGRGEERSPGRSALGCMRDHPDESPQTVDWGWPGWPSVATGCGLDETSAMDIRRDGPSCGPFARLRPVALSSPRPRRSLLARWSEAWASGLPKVPTTLDVCDTWLCPSEQPKGSSASKLTGGVSRTRPP